MHRIAICFAALVLTGCIQPTRYQEMGFTGGVSAQQITADTWRIVARGNGLSNSETIKDFALFKAAETTFDAGGTHFIILGNENASTVTVGSIPGSVSTTVTPHTVRTTYDPGHTYSIPKPGQDLTIKVLKIVPGASPPPGALLATDVYRNVGARVIAYR